jgi:hypothetical protein
MLLVVCIPQYMPEVVRIINIKTQRTVLLAF